MKSFVTIGEVSNRVDALNQNCFDRLVEVPEISFASLERMKIGDHEHVLRPVAQKSVAWSFEFVVARSMPGFDSRILVMSRRKAEASPVLLLEVVEKKTGA